MVIVPWSAPTPRGPEVDPALLAPQPSSPSLQREVPQPPMTNTGAWNGPQRLMRFLGPILQMGLQRRQRGACSLSKISLLGRFSQNHSWSSRQ